MDNNYKCMLALMSTIMVVYNPMFRGVYRSGEGGGEEGGVEGGRRTVSPFQTEGPTFVQLPIEAINWNSQT